ncbi:MAG: methyltransferase domain-containing protein [Streptosporangiales bacterium]|nr:methyltransferase domain-containing protein [Streptosporangiales bacterium]
MIEGDSEGEHVKSFDHRHARPPRESFVDPIYAVVKGGRGELASVGFRIREARVILGWVAYRTSGGHVPMDFDAYERELWAGRAEAYGRGFARMTAYTAPLLLDAVGARPGIDLLDVGTGPGVVAREAVARGSRVRAVDAEPQMLELARRNVPGLDATRAILPELPFPDGSFDAITGNYVINHVGEPPAALAELRRVLRPGGRIALTTWEFPGHRASAVYGDALEEAGVPWPEDVPISPFRAYGERDAFAGLLKDATFGEVRVERLDWTHTVDPEDWWAGPRDGVGSNGVVLSRLDAPTVARVKAAYDHIVAAYATPDGLVALPARALLATAART